MFKVESTILVVAEEKETHLGDQVLEILKSQRHSSCHECMNVSFGKVAEHKYSCIFDEDGGMKFHITAVVEVLPSGSLMVMIGSDI